MPTSKQRVNVVLDDELFSALKALAVKTKKSLSSMGQELIEKALGLEEDFYFSRKADERLSKKGKRISHEDAWK